MYIVTVEGKWRVVCDLSNDTISVDLVKIKGAILLREHRHDAHIPFLHPPRRICNRYCLFVRFSEHELTFTFAICSCPSVCRLSVTLVHPILSRLKFSAIFLRRLVPWLSFDIHGKFYGDRPRRIPPSGGLDARGVAKYSDFWTYRRLYLGNSARYDVS